MQCFDIITWLFGGWVRFSAGVNQCPSSGVMKAHKFTPVEDLHMFLTSLNIKSSRMLQLRAIFIITVATVVAVKIPNIN